MKASDSTRHTLKKSLLILLTLKYSPLIILTFDILPWIYCAFSLHRLLPWGANVSAYRFMGADRCMYPFIKTMEKRVTDGQPNAA